MPQYIFQNPKTKKTKEIFQSMNEPHTYEEGGVKWIRVYTVPQSSVPVRIDPNNPQDFIHKTKHSKGSIGNLLDRSQELSEMRRQNNDKGDDKIQDKFFNDWSKKRKGKKHPEDKRGQKIKNNGLTTIRNAT